jgi:hypothetical protein
MPAGQPPSPDHSLSHRQALDGGQGFFVPEAVSFIGRFTLTRTLTPNLVVNPVAGVGSALLETT